MLNNQDMFYKMSKFNIALLQNVLNVYIPMHIQSIYNIELT